MQCTFGMDNLRHVDRLSFAVKALFPRKMTIKYAGCKQLVAYGQICIEFSMLLMPREHCILNTRILRSMITIRI